MQTIHPLIDKSEIITLILADMRSRKLIMGLDTIGLSTDDFNTNLAELIFSKMDVPRQHLVRIRNWYEETVYRLLDTDLNTFRDHQLFLALNLYDEIEAKKHTLHADPILKNKNIQFPFFTWMCFKKNDN